MIVAKRFVDAVCLSWCLALLFYTLGFYWLPRCFVVVAVIAAMGYLFQIGVLAMMFRQKTREVIVVDSDVVGLGGEGGLGTAGHCTVIGVLGEFRGTISDSGDVYVYGRFMGDIELKEGTIHVMSGGYVKGKLSAVDIVIDGEVEGRCDAQHIGLLSRGVLRGVCCSADFPIQTGGSFVGTSEAWEIPVTPELPLTWAHEEHTVSEG